MSSQTIKYRMVHFKPRFQALFNSRLDSNCHFGNKAPCNFESEDIELLAQIPSLYIKSEVTTMMPRANLTFVICLTVLLTYTAAIGKIAFATISDFWNPVSLPAEGT